MKVYAKFLLIIFFSVFSILLIKAEPAQDSLEIEQLLSSANILAENKEYKTALEYCQKASYILSGYPLTEVNSLVRKYYLTQLKIYLSLFEDSKKEAYLKESINWIDKIIKIDSKFNREFLAEDYYLLGNLLVKNGNIEEAIKAFNKVINFKGEYANKAFVNLEILKKELEKTK